MRIRSACFAMLVMASQISAAGSSGNPDKLACEAGPLTRTYGGVSWLVYGCADKRSILVVSNHDPRSSEYIMLAPLRNGVQVVSEGWSEEDAGNAAFAELKRMSARQLGQLVAETRNASH